MIATIHNILPFDKADKKDIKFTWLGNQIFKVRCRIKNNNTGEIVYDDMVNTMKQAYPLPANSIPANGIKYLIYITVFDVNDNESSPQNPGIPFYCFTTPTFKLSIDNEEYIHSSSYQTTLSYSQAENEELDYFNISVYTYQKTLLQTSGDVYDVSEPSYIMTGLSNATQYYVRATGKTVNGFELDTGYILFTIKFTIAQVFSTLELNNIAKNGSIEIQCHIVSALGIAESDVTYIDDGYDIFADLTNNSVTFDEGFQVIGDFTIKERFHSPIRNKSILSFTDGKNMRCNVYYRTGNYSDIVDRYTWAEPDQVQGDKVCYFEMEISENEFTSIYNSKYLNIPHEKQEFVLIVVRKNGNYDIQAKQIRQNTWADLEGLRWNDLEQYTWNQVRTEDF